MTASHDLEIRRRLHLQRLIVNDQRRSGNSDFQMMRYILTKERTVAKLFNYGILSSVFHPCLSNIQHPTSDIRLPTSDFQLPTSDFRLPTSDF
jgi:hypothetical protein